MASLYDNLTPDPYDDLFEGTDRFGFDFLVTQEFKDWWKVNIYDRFELTPSGMVDILLRKLNRDEKVLFYRFGPCKGQNVLSVQIEGYHRNDIIYLAGETLYLHNPMDEDGLGHHLEIDVLDVDIEHQGKGISAALMGNIYELVKALKMRRISVEAYLDAGPYAWLSYGFVPLVEQWAEIKEKIEDKLKELGGQVSEPALQRIRPILMADEPDALVALLDERDMVRSHTRNNDGTWGEARVTTLSRALIADSGQRWQAILDLDDNGSKLLLEDCVRRNQP